MLGDCYEGRCAKAIEILQQLVHMQNEGLFLRHRQLVAIEAINDDCAHAVLFHALTRTRWAEFARGKLGRVDLLHYQASLFAKPLQINPHPFGAPKQEAEFLIESEQGRLLAAAMAATAN